MKNEIINNMANTLELISLRGRDDLESEKIYELFLKNEETEFKKYMGYGKDTIERIGWEKFIESMDWSKPDHISSWRTDRVRVVPCIECDDNFALYDLDYSICKNCMPLYDVDSMNSAVSQLMDVSNPGDISYDYYDFVQSLMFSKEFRERFKKDK